MKKKFFVLAFLVAFFLPAFSISKILSPAAGTWANKQMIALSLSRGENAFYSLTGSDPLHQGFAYDKPALLDLAGDVHVRVAFVNSDGAVRYEDVFFTVNEKNFYANEITNKTLNETSNENVNKNSYDENFLSAMKNGFVMYKTGETFSIPQNLSYSLGLENDVFQKGKMLSLPYNCILDEAVPCVIFDGETKWRILIEIENANLPTFSKKNLPFTISDWTNLRFENKKLIYKIDGEFWKSYDEVLQLDRNSAHTISWQSIEYEKGNPVEDFVLPAKPKIAATKNADGSVSLSFVENAGFTFGNNLSNNSYALYKTATLDVFSGDEKKGDALIPVFFEGTYQGDYRLSFSIDKKPPRAPQFFTQNENHYFRNAISVSLSSEQNAKVFLALEKFELAENTENFLADKSVTEFLETKNFLPFENREIFLEQKTDVPVGYKLFSYAIDESGNKSDVSFFFCVIDEHDFYVDEKKGSAISIGTKQKPFAHFSDIPLKNIRYARIHISGDIHFPKGETRIFSNCTIIGEKNARVIFPSDATFSLESATLEIKNCFVIRKDERTAMKAHFILLNHSVLSLFDSELAVSFAKSGTAIISNNGSVNVKNATLSSTAQNYCACISGTNTNAKIFSANISSSAETAVCLSMQNGNCEMRKSNCSLEANYGRIAEFFSCKARIVENSFYSKLSHRGIRETNAVYTDNKKLLLEYRKNFFENAK